MSINNKNPEVITDLPLQGVDAALQDIAKRLATISWLEKSWGRAYSVMTQQSNNRPSYNPMVYISKSEYYEVVPNDRFKAFSFWGVDGPEQAEDQINFSMTNSMWSTDVYGIFWCDLKKINRDADHIFTQDLIQEVLTKLKLESSFTLTRIYDEKIEDIYRGFVLDPGQRDLLMYPHAGFRIEGKLNYSLTLC